MTKKVSGFQNTVYWTNWSVYARQYPPQKLPADKVNQVLYSFMNVRADGTVRLSFSGDTYADLEQHYPTDSWNDVGKNAYGAVKQLGLIKKSNRRLKVILSIGGWTWSTNFPAVAASPTARANFAKTSVELVKDWGLDGIDIDWEYPASSADADNFILLLKAVRAELDAYSAQYAGGYKFLLTAAVPAGPSNYNILRLGQMGQILDYLNLMAYDYAGGWDLAHTGHQANLYPNPLNPDATPFSTDRAVNDYLAAGVPARKIVMGIPLYGRAFEGTSGLGQPATGTGQGTWEAGVYDYKALPLAGSVEKYDIVAGASYSEDTSAKRIVSYDTIESVTKKLGFVSTKGLGGTMFWEASGDRTDSKSIIAKCFNDQGGDATIDQTQNLLKYPNSTYDNIRNGL
ncbi:family 18 glycosyl hydrolase [Microdochium trichocladiopsis]|uniref:chitinase n=1 Tax=Microdochium trichocladiopsis TaxID=1682393 RepID=A0A9P9BP01_9PEZI|nr:family 18 glycosyl hydrolase [Microdochium trichocladiopsis]KAH7028014.1 family 18 glycosyl hydrolase [Microdochium trichocladiopsis]